MSAYKFGGVIRGLCEFAQTHWLDLEGGVSFVQWVQKESGRVLKLDKWRRILERMCLNLKGDWEDSSKDGFHSSFPNDS